MKIKNRKIPSWIKTLKKGVYDMNDLIQHSGLTGKCSINRVMISNGAKVKKVRIMHNLLKNVYYWDGFKEPEKPESNLKFYKK